MQPEQVARRSCPPRGLAFNLLVACCACACDHAAEPRSVDCDQAAVCVDSDCDTLCDDAEDAKHMRDTDRDGTPDFLDLDADGDGVPDMEEAGDDDPRTPAFDRNLDGKPDYLDKHYPLDVGKTRGAGGAGETMTTTSAATSPNTCGAPLDLGCASREAESCNGLDDDCNGAIDEGVACECLRGQVRACFLGAPGQRHVGACTDGTQVCTGSGAAHWGPCTHSTGPRDELCNGVDDDCNGCVDEQGSCESGLSCPSPNDPRTPIAQPFAPYLLDAGLFYTGSDVQGYQWYIAGSPCDRLAGAIDPEASATRGDLSYTLANADKQRAQATFTLSGDYDVMLRIVTARGDLHCGFTIHVRGPGLRVELCWDKTGPASRGDAVDLDLHVAKRGATDAFLTPTDCYAQTCSGTDTPWDYADTFPASRCTGESARNYALYEDFGGCPNPRLEADYDLNATSLARYGAENINLDSPRQGDQFRVMVHYKASQRDAADADDAGMPAVVETHPIVNIYCDGALRGSFGGIPELLGDGDELGLASPGQMWRVADIVSSDGTCSVDPLAPRGVGSGYWVSGFDASYAD